MLKYVNRHVSSHVFGFRSCILFCSKTTPVNYKRFGFGSCRYFQLQNVYVINGG